MFGHGNPKTTGRRVEERDTKSHDKCPWDISGISTLEKLFPLKGRAGSLVWANATENGQKKEFLRPQVVLELIFGHQTVWIFAVQFELVKICGNYFVVEISL